MYNDEFVTYKALTDEEIENERSILKDGEYQFEVIKSVKKMTSETAKNPNQPMFEVDFRVWNHAGKEYFLRDWFTFIPKMIYKLKNFWSSVGEPEVYKSEKISADMMVGKCGTLKTKLSKNDKGYDQAKIVDYITVIRTNTQHVRLHESGVIDDDIPF